MTGLPPPPFEPIQSQEPKEPSREVWMGEPYTRDPYWPDPYAGAR